jgi:uncharacterized membrane protein
MSDWYYAADNEQKGPINESELKAHFATNKLPTDTLVWKDGMENWTPANQVPAFSFRQPPAPAKTQPASLTPAPETVAQASPTVDNPESVKPIGLSDIVGPSEALEVDAEDAEKNKIFGILAYIGILCLVPIFAAKDSPFAKYHGNQGLVLFIVWVVLAFAEAFLGTIFATFLPGSLVSAILSILYLGPLALLVLGVMNAAAGKCVPLPVIGGFKLVK